MFFYFILYMCLDTWMTIGSNEHGDIQKKEWAAREDNYLQSNWKGTQLSSVKDLKELKRLSPVKDLRPGLENRTVPLNNIYDFLQIMDFIYQIRCNLFHGGKMALIHRDRELVKFSSQILKSWIECILREA